MGKKFFFKCLLLCCFYNSGIFKSKGQITFERLFNLPLAARAYSALPVNNGYILLIDVFDSSGFGQRELLKVNEFGDTLWRKVIGGGLYFQMIISADSIIHLIGENGQGIVSQYNLSGDFLRSFDLVSYDSAMQTPLTIYPIGICKSLDGGFFISGAIDSSVCCLKNLLVMKTDSLFNVIWVWKKYYDIYRNTSADIIETSDHSILVEIGSENIIQQPISHLFKLNSQGDFIWAKTIYNVHNYYSLIETSNKEYVHCGNTNSGNGLNSYIEKLDSSGNMIWRDTILNSWYNSLCSSGDNEITVTGSALNSFSQIRIFLRKYDSSGHLTLDRSYRNDIDGIAYFIKETPDSGFVIAAAGRVFPARENCYLIKTDSAGDIITDIQNVYKQKISFYPNPFKNNFNIDFIENGKYEIKFYNSSGTLILKEDFQGNVLSFDLNKYSDGIYFVKIQDKKSNKIYSEKFIKISDK